MDSVTPRSTIAGDRKLLLTLAVLASAQLITALDFNIVYVALPEIGDRLGFSHQSLQWVFSAYSVVFGGFLLVGGRAADMFGRRRMFVLGLAIYAGASLLGGLASGPITIITARAVQGMGGAVLFPATVSLINTLFEEGPTRNRALALWSLAGSTGLTLGSLLGGILVGTLGWRSVFFVNVPIAILVAIGALLAVPRDHPGPRRQGLDLPGAITGTAGVTSLVFTLVQAPAWGWASAPILLSVAAAVVLLVAFAGIEARSASPVMPIGLITQGGLAACMLLAFMFMATFMAMPYFTTELFQRIYRYNPLETGFAFLAPCLAIATGTQISGRFVTRIGVRPMLLSGLSVGAIGAAMVARHVAPDHFYAGLVPGLVIFGLGQGAAWVAMWIAAASGVAPHEQGIASAMASTSLWVGGAAGLAVLVAIATTWADAATAAGAVANPTQGIRAAIFAIAAGIALSLPIAALASRTCHQSNTSAPKLVTRTGARQSFTPPGPASVRTRRRRDLAGGPAGSAGSTSGSS